MPAETQDPGQGQGQGQDDEADEGRSQRLGPERERAFLAPSVLDGIARQRARIRDFGSLAASEPALQVGIGAIAGAIVVVMVLAMNGRLRSETGVPATDAPPGPTALAATSPAPTSVVGGVTSIFETFDDMRTYSTLPPPWRVIGDGSAEIVARPTSVDRSVRIVSSEAGASTALCRPLDVGAATHVMVAFDYLLGRPPAGGTILLTLDAGVAGSFELSIGPTGAAIRVTGPDGPASGASPPPAPPNPRAGSAGREWQRVVVTVDPRAGQVSWENRDSFGGKTDSGIATVAIARDRLETLCLHSPTGSAAWVAINDLNVER